MKMESRCLPLRVYFALLQTTDSTSSEAATQTDLTEQMLAAEGIPALAELEEMMVSAHMFAERVQPHMPAGAAS